MGTNASALIITNKKKYPINIDKHRIILIIIIERTAKLEMNKTLLSCLYNMSLNGSIIFVGIECETKFGHRIHMSPSHYILLNIILS